MYVGGALVIVHDITSYDTRSRYLPRGAFRKHKPVSLHHKSGYRPVPEPYYHRGFKITFT